MRKKQRSKPSDAAADGSTGALDLLDDGAAPGEGTEELKVSEKFAKRYNERKDREELTRARRLLEDEDADQSSSETEPEDEGAELLTDKVETKIFETLHKIRSKDPAIYDRKKAFFEDADFDSQTAASSSEVKKGVRYKDFLRETLLKDGADAIAREEEALDAKGAKAKLRKGQTVAEEQKDLRADIVSAAKSLDDDDDDDLFTIKEKTADEMNEEQSSFAAFTERKNREGKSGDADDIMARYWKSDEDLGHSESFLRDYILNKGWLETTSMQPSSSASQGKRRGAVSDEEDEDHLDQADNFEEEYNFRFEVEEGRQIQSHARFQEASVRDRGDKRKRQRKEHAERKEADKIRRTEELKRLKNLKKQEIMRRLQQIQEITGNDGQSALGNICLDGDFDPDAHDAEMARVIGEDYDNKEEALAPEDLVKAPRGLDDLDTETAQSAAERRAKEAASKAIARGKKTAGSKAVETEEQEGDWDGNQQEEAAQEEEEEEADPEQWWLCDGCQKGIPGGKRRFDCTICENFTLCVKCFRIRRHPHKFVRRRVPERNMPPEDLKGAEANRDDIQDVLDEYFQLDYEDIIGGDLPTRFKYAKVESNSFGMTPDDILRKTDQELNRAIPIKKLRTYRGARGGGNGDDQSGARRQRAFGKGLGRGHGAVGRGKGAGRGGSGRGQQQASGRGGLSAERIGAYGFQPDRQKKWKKARRDGGGGRGK